MVISGFKIICYGDSNVKRHKRKLFEILPQTKFILSYDLEEMKEKLHVIQEEKFGALLIHQLTNDVEKICQKNWSDNDKKMELISLADNFVIMIERLKREHPNLEIFISMLMPRFDHMDELEMFNGKNIVNCEISKKLQNVTLLSNDFLQEMHFVQEGRKKFHLSSFGFEQICKNWKTEIETKFT